VVRVPGYRSRDPGFDFRRYQIFWEVLGLERGPLSLVTTIEVLLGRNSSGSGLENREYGRGDPLRWPRDTLYPQNLALTSPTCGDRSIGTVRFRTKTTELSCEKRRVQPPTTCTATHRLITTDLPPRGSITRRRVHPITEFPWNIRIYFIYYCKPISEIWNHKGA
jgi:hypothetical protein